MNDPEISAKMLSQMLEKISMYYVYGSTPFCDLLQLLRQHGQKKTKMRQHILFDSFGPNESTFAKIHQSMKSFFEIEPVFWKAIYILPKNNQVVNELQVKVE